MQRVQTWAPPIVAISIYRDRTDIDRSALSEGGRGKEIRFDSIRIHLRVVISFFFFFSKTREDRTIGLQTDKLLRLIGL